MKRRALIGLALCTAVLAAAYPLLFGLEAYPRQLFYGEGGYSITPAGSAELNETFASTLSNQSWAATVSPEVYVFTSWDGEPVVARGVNVTAFLTMDGATLVEGVWRENDFVLAGEGLASRRSVHTGSSGVIAGSNLPRIESLDITGVFRSGMPSNDELLIPLTLARRLGGHPLDYFSAIRLRTSDASAMFAFLQDSGMALAVASDAGTTYLNTPLGKDGRLSSLAFLYPELWHELGRSYVHGFAQQGANGVRVVIYALLILITVLAVVGIYAVVWRATMEASRSIGIVRVVGARPRILVTSLLHEFLVVGLFVMLGGILIGTLASYLAGSFGVFYLFSHSIRPHFDALLMLETYLVALSATTLSILLCTRASLRRPPRDLVSAVEPRPESIPEEVLPI